MNTIDMMVLSIAEEIGFVLLKVCFKGGTKNYTYLADKNAGIEAGDTVVVNSPVDGLVCVKVDEVLPSDEIDMNVNFNYRWIVQKVDTTAYDATVAREAHIRNVLRKAELRKARTEMLKNFEQEVGADVMLEVRRVAGIEQVNK